MTRTDVYTADGLAATDLPLARLCSMGPGSALLSPSALSAIVRECGAFPRKQRLCAWRLALQLPGNERAHASLLSRGPHAACARLGTSMPLSDRRALARLERFLSCLAHWCPLFSMVSELPPAAFPWVVCFGADDLAAFEAAATVLVNWGQSRNEYHPHPPVCVQQVVLRIVTIVVCILCYTVGSHDLLSLGRWTPGWGGTGAPSS